MDCISCSGNSKQRRDMLKIETDKLGEALPFDYGKISQLRILKATCNYLKKEKYFSNLRNVCVTDQKDEIMNFEETIENESFTGFLVCFSKVGELVYISNTSYEHLGMRSLDILFAYDKIQDLIHEQDKHNFEELEDDFILYQDGGKTFSFFCLWCATKSKRAGTALSDYKLIKMTGHFDVTTQLFFATCTQILSVSNRELLIALSSDCFTSIHDSTLRFKEIDTNIENLLCYDLEKDDFKNQSLYGIISFEYLTLVKERHLNILKEKNMKGCLDPVKILHKDGHFVDCLMNMYSDLKGQIVCKFQIIDHSSMNDYKDYVLNFKKNWSSYLINENITKSEIQISQQSCNKTENEESNFLFPENTNDLKRKRTASECSEIYETNSKKSNCMFDLENMIDLDEENIQMYSESPLVLDVNLDNGNSIIDDEFFQTTGFLNGIESGDLRYFDLNDLIEIQKIEKVIKEEVSDKKFPICFPGPIDDSNMLEYDNKFHNIALDDHFFHTLIDDGNLDIFDQTVLS